MERARWIWYYGDFELYHNILVHDRREDYGVSYPAFWNLSTPFPRVDFITEFTCPVDTEITVVSKAHGFVVLGADQDFAHRPLNTPIAVPAGAYRIKVVTMRFGGLPSIYIDSEYLKTDSRWLVAAGGTLIDPKNGAFSFHAGDTPGFFGPDADPEIFPFSYTKVEPVSSEQTDGELRLDFGKELFAKLIITQADAAETLTVVYGESAEEADDPQYAKVRETVSGRSDYELKARGFRYVCLHSRTAPRVYALYEYLPLESTGRFSCDVPLVESVFDTCAYTLALCSREFYFDGIKRDRWLWSGDAYQSYMINKYLFFDPEIIKRSLIATFGKPPYDQHINTINGYSDYAILSLWDYYESFGDLDFLRFMYPRVSALYAFIVSRLDENGFSVGRPGDWPFVDWAPFDASGPLAAEQILLWQTHRCMERILCALGKDGTDCRHRAEQLRETIDRLFWNGEKGGYIDTFASGENHITRHANVFALMYDFVDAERANVILRRVLKNPEIPPITTPYFEFYELIALCKAGELGYMQDMLESYWGGMLRLGATTIWEQFDPHKTGAQHYAMYGQKYGCSLCHAWGAGPVYLLGRFCAGVYPTSIGYKTFAVAPNPGKYKRFKGTVPVLGGTVCVDYTEDSVRVLTDRAGGELLFEGTYYPLEPGRETVVPLR